jgi:C4-dicarboxylate-specific signal transduction histidine kinase
VTIGKQQQRFLSLWVLALWGTGIGIGLFGILQVARLKDEVRTLANEVVELSSKFSILGAQEAHILEHAKGLLAAAQDGAISETELTELRALSPQATVALEQLERVILEIDRGVQRLTGNISAEESALVTNALGNVLIQARLHREEGTKLLAFLDEPSLALQSLGKLKTVAATLDKELRQMDHEVARTVLLFAAESIERSERFERSVFLQLAAATFVGLLLGIFIIYRIRAMQSQLIQAEQLGVLAKLAISLQHEINNPLSVIVGNAYLLRSAKLSDSEKVSAIQAVESSAKSISEVLKRTKDMERLVTTEYVGGLEMVDLSEKK